MAQTPPNWYSDPQNPKYIRYWYGDRWSNEVYLKPEHVGPDGNKGPFQVPLTPAVREEQDQASDSLANPGRDMDNIRSSGSYVGRRRAAVDASDELPAAAEPASTPSNEVTQAISSSATSFVDKASGLNGQIQEPPAVVIPEGTSSALFGGKEIKRLQAAVTALQQENSALRQAFRSLNILSPEEIAEKRSALELSFQEQENAAKLRLMRSQEELNALELVIQEKRIELAQLMEQVAVGSDTLILQTVGFYNFNHPLETALEFKDALARITDKRKVAAKKGDAVTASTSWTVNNSQREGAKMVNQISKLMLRAYTNEFETLVRNMKPYKLEASIDRLNKSMATVEKLGTAMNIKISPAYHFLCIEELKLTADFLEMKEREKEREREEKERLREERQAQAEFERQKALKEKELRQKEEARRQLTILLAQLQDPVKKAEAEASLATIDEQLHEIESAIEDVEARAANIKAGFVYVISNVGSFGESMIKIGMTRRENPMDRVNELGDASVPFKFDVHMLHYSNDARDIEANLHRHFAAQRVNQINSRKEFFYATLREVEAALKELGLSGSITTFEEEAPAPEYRQSETIRRAS